MPALRIDVPIPSPEKAYVVGGSVRDLLLGRSPTDYDIVIPNPDIFSLQVAKALGAVRVILGKAEQRLYRVIKDRLTFDITELQGETIEADLGKRDFTLNALAFPFPSGNIIDCTGGITDIRERMIRMVSPSVFSKDPVRLIRAFRFASQLSFTIHRATLAEIEKNRRLIGSAAGERIRIELLKLLEADHALTSMELLMRTGLLFEILKDLPEKPLGGISTDLHKPDISRFMEAFAKLEAALCSYPADGFFHADSNDWGKRGPLLKLARILSFLISSNGKCETRFNEIFHRLRLSTHEKKILLALIRWEPLLHRIFSFARRGRADRREAYRFFRDCEDMTPAILFYTMAPLNADLHPPDAIFMDFLGHLASLFAVDYASVKQAPPLLTGEDLITVLGLPPSPLFKHLLGLVAEERFVRMDLDREGALGLAKDYLMASPDRFLQGLPS